MAKLQKKETSLIKLYTKVMNLHKEACEKRRVPDPGFSVSLETNQAFVNGFVYSIKPGKMQLYLENKMKRSQMILDSVTTKEFSKPAWDALVDESMTYINGAAKASEEVAETPEVVEKPIAKSERKLVVDQEQDEEKHEPHDRDDNEEE